VRGWRAVYPRPVSFRSLQPDRPPNGAQRLVVALDRDGASCVWCSRGFSDLVRPTREHVVPRVKGGPSIPENEVAACARCNRERGHASPVQWLDEVRARGREPRPEVIEASLRRLAAHIEERGGLRRIRGYLTTELRKLDRDRHGR
jgi:5-methylcytosine-specific restriction endonuclease McrA